MTNLPKSLLILALKRNKQLLVGYFLKNYNLTEKSLNRFWIDHKKFKE
tara:strand:- start:1879 stop:2022 length:144 start_codon:yes stop_codon:yes gene_type:complete